jgi:hypothetical protein
MFDRVKPIERLEVILEFIKESQEEHSYKHSTRCPGKRHLGVIPLASQQQIIAKNKKTIKL